MLACMHGHKMVLLVHVLFVCMQFSLCFMHYILWFCLCLYGFVYTIQLQLKLNKTQTNILIRSWCLHICEGSGSYRNITKHQLKWPNYDSKCCVWVQLRANIPIKWSVHVFNYSSGFTPRLNWIVTIAIIASY